jgi:uncharacterized protein (TIGR03545 family)
MTTPKTEKKAKGPIRFEAVVPFTIIVALTFVYFKFFFDIHLKKAIEIGGYYANGAEVNVADIDTSFWKLSFDLYGLQVTNAENPKKNSIEIGHIHSELLWDALLRFKFVVPDASITGIKTWSDRKTVGKVKPKEIETDSGPGALDQAKDKGLQVAKEQFKGNALGDIANVAGGADVGGTLGNIEGQLKSKAYIEQLTTELKGKEQEWKQKIDSLPKTEELNNLKARIQNLKINTSNIQELQKGLQEVDALAKEANSKVGGINGIVSSLQTDLDKYSKAIQKVDELVKADQEMLMSRLKVPSLDAKDLAGSLFGPEFTNKLAMVEKYMRMARKYAPPKKTEEQKAALAAEKIVPPPRGHGENFQFGKPNSYPLFWLKSATITSDFTGKQAGGVKGTLKDVTSDPPAIGKPMVLDVAGDLPEEGLTGVQLKVVVDHVTSVAKESLLLKVGGFPVEGQMFSNTDDIKLGFQKASASSALKIELQDENVNVQLNNALQNIDYITASKNDQVAGILKGIVTDIPKVTLDASAVGSWSDLKMDIRSNLGEELQKGFTKALQAKIDEAKAKVNEVIEKQIGPQKAALTKQFDDVKSKYLGQAESKKNEVAQIENQAKGKATGAQKAGQKGAEDKAKQEVQKGLEDLKKQFKF